MKQSMKRHYNSDSKTCIKAMKYICILLFFISCNGQKKIGSSFTKFENKNDKQNELVFLLSDNYSGLVHPEILILKEPKALRDFFSQINRTRKPGLAIPSIDFEKEMVIIYCTGEKLGVHTPRLVQTQENVNEYTVQVILSENQDYSEVKTSSFCMYKRKTSNKEFTFEKLQ